MIEILAQATTTHSMGEGGQFANSAWDWIQANWFWLLIFGGSALALLRFVVAGFFSLLTGGKRGRLRRRTEKINKFMRDFK